ncbi:MAG TPA: hypothetical protein VMW17_05850 [Candidatus Binatia bacterium]|nr:hypothetical protein [Candidatus Binatia bacterium]
MKVLTANHSSFPRLAAARTDRDAMATAVAAQQDAGLDLVTDGHLCDAEHVVRSLSGFEFGQARAFFATASRLRTPIVRDRVHRISPALVDHFRMASDIADRPVKAVFVGPYTLARLSVIETSAYPTYRELAQDLAGALAGEVRDLAAAGAPMIQIDEPAICQHAEDIRLLRQLFEPLYAARGNAEIAIATYFFDSDPLYPQLNSIPADIVAVDLSCSPRLAQTIADTGASKLLALGVVDGRNPQLEDAAAVANSLSQLLHRYALDTVYLQPSCGLSELTAAQAIEKLRLLGTIRTALVQRMAA